MNQKIIEEFRANQGRVGGPFAGMQLLLVTTKGAKSGQPRTIPVAYTMDGDNYVIVASKGGADTHPDWYYNLVTNPRATAEVGAESFDVETREAHGEEHERLYAQHATEYPGFWDYKDKTARKIPVFVLKRV